MKQKPEKTDGLKELMNDIKSHLKDFAKEPDPTSDNIAEHIEYLEDVIKDIEYQVGKVQDEIWDLENELKETQETKDVYEADLGETFTPANLNEVDKVEILKRLFLNMSVNQLLELEKSGKTMNKNYNEYAA